MRRLLCQVIASATCSFAFSQQQQGTVVYDRVVQMQLNVQDNDGVSQMMPKTKTDRFELIFGNNKSIYKHVDEETNGDESGGEGIQIRMVTPGENDIVFSDFSNNRKVEQREAFERTFIVADSIHRLNWKLSPETKQILGHSCQKATAQNIGKRMQMNIDNGKMERKEVPDTSEIIAWFTSDIPVPAGPEVQGQLPGLILGLDMNHGRMIYTATELNAKADVAAIKEPSKGKKVTPAQFIEERNKMMDEMQKNNGGGGNRIIIRD